MEGLLHDRVRSTEGEDAEPGEEVEVAPISVVDQVAPLAALVEAVEPQGLHDASELRVQVLRVELEVLTSALMEDGR